MPYAPSNCSQVPRGYGRVVLTLPEPQPGFTDYIKYMWIGCMLIEFNCAAYPNGVGGSTGEEYASNLAKAIGYRGLFGNASSGSCNSPSLNTARGVNYDLHARHLGGNQVEILIKAGEECCTAEQNAGGISLQSGTVSLFHENPYGFSFRYPFATAGSVLQCCPPSACTTEPGRIRVDIRVEGWNNSIYNNKPSSIKLIPEGCFGTISVSTYPEATTQTNVFGSIDAWAAIINNPVFQAANASLGFTVVKAGLYLIIEFNKLTETCCAEGAIFDLITSSGSGAGGGEGETYCCTPPEPPCEPVPYPALDCGLYPNGTHILRFRIVDNGQQFGVGSPDVRWWLGECPYINPDPPHYLTSIAYFDYTNFDQFCDGLAAYYQQYYSSLCAANNGFVSIQHYGCGYFEVAMTETCIDEVDACIELDSWSLCEYNPLGDLIYLTVELGDKLCCELDTPQIPDAEIWQPPADKSAFLPISCLLIENFGCCKTGVGGVRNVYAINRVYYDSVYLDDVGRIAQINQTQEAAWTDLCLNHAITQLSITQITSGEGVSFEHTLACNVPIIDYNNRLVLQKLQYTDVVLLIQDNNGRYWLLGENFPCKTTQIQGTTGAGLASANNHTFVFIEKNYYHCREVLSSAVELLNLTGVNCEDFVGQPLENVYLAQLNDCYLYDLANNYLVY